MTKLLENAYSSESFRETGHKLIDQLADYLETLKNKPEGEKVLPYLEPNKQLEKWQNHLKTDISIEETFKQIIEGSIHIHHPHYVGHQVTAPIPLASLSELLGSLLNNGQAIYEMGPVSQAMERIVIEWIAAKFGFPAKAEGVMTSGGTIGNLTALLAARQAKADFNVWNDGNSNQKLAFMVSEHSHYSMDRAVKIMGLGEAGIVKVPVDKKLRIDISQLETVYKKAISKGKIIIGLVANAGTTATGSYDFLDAIGDFCESKNIWFHVDAAHGGAVAVSNKLKHLIKGIEKADSIVVDFHKMFMAPALTTAVVFKNPAHSYQTFSQKASYLLNTKNNWYDGASRTMECTKIMLSLRVYPVLHAYGEQVFADYVETTYQTAHEFSKLILNTENFELLFEPQSNIVCFRYIPESNLSDEQLNKINAEVRNRIVESGSFYLVQAELLGRLYLRVVVMNPFTKVEDLKILLNEI